MFNNIDITSESNITDSLMNILPVGMVIVNNLGCIEKKNTLSNKIINNTNVLSINNNKLKIHDYNSAVLYNAIFSTKSSFGKKNQATLISIPENTYNKIELLIIYLSTNTYESKCCVFIRNPNINTYIDRERLEFLYKLTTTESIIAIEITTGLSVTTIATKLEIQENTVRTHLKRIYSKTNTNTQSNLVSLLANNMLLNLISAS